MKIIKEFNNTKGKFKILEEMFDMCKESGYNHHINYTIEDADFCEGEFIRNSARDKRYFNCTGCHKRYKPIDYFNEFVFKNNEFKEEILSVYPQFLFLLEKITKSTTNKPEKRKNIISINNKEKRNCGNDNNVHCEASTSKVVENVEDIIDIKRLKLNENKGIILKILFLEYLLEKNNSVIEERRIYLENTINDLKNILATNINSLNSESINNNSSSEEEGNIENKFKSRIYIFKYLKKAERSLHSKLKSQQIWVHGISKKTIKGYKKVLKGKKIKVTKIHNIIILNKNLSELLIDKDYIEEILLKINKIADVYSTQSKEDMKKYYLEKLKKGFNINFKPKYIQARKNTNKEYVKSFYKHYFK